MRLPLYALPFTAVVLEGLLLWRFSKHRLWSRYPYIAVFVLYRLLGDAFLFPIHRYAPDRFPVAFWRIETIALFLQFLVNWEFFRRLLGRQSTLHDIGWKVLLTAELILIPSVLILGWSQASSVHYAYLHLSPVVVQYVCFTQAILLLTPAAVAWYYRVPLGRNILGLGLGFGAYVFVRAVNFASLQVFRGYFPYWQLLTPLTFIGMVAVWLWAFWEYAPSPEPAAINEPQSDQPKAEWQRLWTRTMKMLRRGIT